jgi:opacity protein-like surface antigen
MHGVKRGCLALWLLLVAGVAPASADVTAFLGANTTPANRSVKGIAVGAGLLIVSFEFEYAATAADESELAPSLKTGMANILLQTPVAIHGFQPYVTAGTGIYRERLGSEVQTGIAPNVGGGLKIGLAGPVRLRVDYRVLRLGSGALYSPAHRVYVGLNLKF